MTTKKHDEDVKTDAGKPVTLLELLLSEQFELSRRLSNLNAFVDSAQINTVDREERERLLGQRTAMSHYLEILTARVAYHQARAGEAK